MFYIKVITQGWLIHHMNYAFRVRGRRLNETIREASSKRMPITYFFGDARPWWIKKKNSTALELLPFIFHRHHHFCPHTINERGTLTPPWFGAQALAIYIVHLISDVKSSLPPPKGHASRDCRKTGRESFIDLEKRADVRVSKKKTARYMAIETREALPRNVRFCAPSPCSRRPRARTQ